jgi:hypothetical protein
MKQVWAKAGDEPGLWELLADPIVLSLMRADNITRRDVLTASVHVLDRHARPEDVAQLA